MTLTILHHTQYDFLPKYQKIPALKKLVRNPDSRSKIIRIDWSENVDLFQAQEENLQYYNTNSASVNVAIIMITCQSFISAYI